MIRRMFLKVLGLPLVITPVAAVSINTKIAPATINTKKRCFLCEGGVELVVFQSRTERLYCCAKHAENVGQIVKLVSYQDHLNGCPEETADSIDLIGQRFVNKGDVVPYEVMLQQVKNYKE